MPVNERRAGDFKVKARLAFVRGLADTELFISNECNYATRS